MNAIKPNVDEVNRLESAVFKIGLPVVEPIPVNEVQEYSLIRALPYYILRYGMELERLAPFIKNKWIRYLLVGMSKALYLIGRYYKIV